MKKKKMMVKQEKKKGELEKQRLHEGMSQPIDQQSKGYELLAKMGFKPGMVLGKKREDGRWLLLFECINRNCA